MGIFDKFRIVNRIDNQIEKQNVTFLNAEKNKSKVFEIWSNMPDDLKKIVGILKDYGCDIRFSDSDIRIAYDTSWYSEYRVIKSDGIYFYREIGMGAYNLEKRLECTDIYLSFVILCSEIISGMKRKKMIHHKNAEYITIVEILKLYKTAVEELFATADIHSVFLIEQFNNITN